MTSQPAPAVVFLGAPDPALAGHVTALCQEGLSVRPAHSVAEAVRLLEGAGLVVVRGHLPGQSGAEACRQLRASPAAAGAAILRLCAPGDAEEEALADGWLVEPVSPRALRSQARALLRARAAERALRDSEALYHSLVESLPVRIFRKDREGRFTFANEAFCAEMGRPAEEIIGRRDRDFFPEELAGKYVRDDRAVMEDEKVFEDVEEHVAPGGEKGYVEVIKAPVRDAAGRVVGMQGVFWDVTARKRAEAEVARTAAEMAVACRIQQQLFPQAPPALPPDCGLDVGGGSWPAEAIGGDSFDFLSLPDGALGIAVGDVSGHGVGSALLMAIARSYLRACAEAEARVGAILERVNRLLAPDMEGDRYITLLLAHLDPRARLLTHASAGHVNGYVVGADGAPRRALESTGVPLGIAPSSAYPSGEPVALLPGDLVLLLTDGVMEARGPDDQPFGAKRALDLVRHYRYATARQIAGNLYHAARAYARNEPQLDDITVVVVKVAL